jgi:hypothetical protein
VNAAVQRSIPVEQMMPGEIERDANEAVARTIARYLALFDADLTRIDESEHRDGCDERPPAPCGLAHRVALTMEPINVLEALEEAFAKYGQPEIEY